MPVNVKPQPDPDLCLGEFDELDAAELRMKERSGLNVWGRPIKVEDRRWHQPGGALPGNPVRTDPQPDPAPRRGRPSTWKPTPALIRAVRERCKTDGPAAIAAEFGVPDWRIHKMAKEHGVQVRRGARRSRRAGGGDAATRPDDPDRPRGQAEATRDDTAIRPDDTAIRRDDTAIRRDDTAIRRDDTAIRRDDTAIRRDDARSVPPPDPDGDAVGAGKSACRLTLAELRPLIVRRLDRERLAMDALEILEAYLKIRPPETP